MSDIIAVRLFPQELLLYLGNIELVLQGRIYFSNLLLHYG